MTRVGHWSMGWMMLAGCGAPQPVNNGDISDSDIIDTDMDTDIDEPDYFVPIAFEVRAEFGWDAQAENLIDVFEDGVLRSNVLLVIIGDATYFSTFDPGYACQMVWNLDPSDYVPGGGNTPMPAEWSDGNANSWLGITTPDGTTPLTDCANWDPAVWDGDPIDMFAFDWGVGVGPMSDPIAGVLDGLVKSKDLTPEERDTFIGGGAWSDHFATLDPRPDDVDESGYLNGGWANGFEIDNEFNMVRDDGTGDFIVLTTNQVESDGALNTGFYQTSVTLMPFTLLD